jgi:hypothetical protein
MRHVQRRAHELFLSELLAHDTGAMPDVGAWFATREAAEQKAFAAHAVDQGVAPLLYDRLHAVGRHTELPLPVLAPILDATSAALTAVAARRNSLSQVLQALGAAGVTPLVIGGAALAHQVYRPAHTRPWSDVTLLIDDIERARANVVLDLRGARGKFGGLQVTCVTQLGDGPFAGMPTHAEARTHAIPLPTLGDAALTVGRPTALLWTLARLAGPSSRLIWLQDAWRLLQAMPRAERRSFLTLAGEARLNGIAASGLSRVSAQFERGEPAAAHYLAHELAARAARLPREPAARTGVRTLWQRWLQRDAL